jgi:hypothetical protein
MARARSNAKARRERSEVAIAAAEQALGEVGVRCIEDIDVDLVCGFFGAFVLYGPLVREEAHVLHSGARAIIRVAEKDRGTPRGRHSGFHELGHFRMHRADQFARCTNGDGEKRGTPFRLEREANDFAALVTMPEFLFAPMCGAAQPTIADVAAVADAFGTSLTSTAIRYAELSASACAVVLSENGRIKWRVCSDAFAGRPIKGRAVDERTRAAKLHRGDVDGGDVDRGDVEDAERRSAIAVEGEAWGGVPASEIVEESVKLGELPLVLSWLWHW